jgi:hypothetical protein
VLTVKSGMDPHMTKLWNLMLNWCFIFIYDAITSLIGSVWTYTLSNYVANKTWPTKMLNCLNLSHPPYGLACYDDSFLLSTSCAHACLFSCICNTRITAQTGRTLKITPMISRSSRCACLQSAACGGIFIRCENSLFMFRLRLWSCNNSLFVWHWFWYSQCRCVCVTWSWCTRDLCIRFCL